MNENDGWTTKRTRWPKRRDIYDRDGVKPYLTRWWLIGSSKTRWALMLHKMHRPDNDTCHHDHPWSFITIVLKGGYFEEVTVDEDGAYTLRLNKPGYILYRPAEHTHRIEMLPKGVCWTLVLRFRKRRHWGFHTSQGWVRWRDFIDLRGGIDWCGDLIRRFVR